METRTLINSVAKMYPVVTFLHDRYFPDGKKFYSEEALIESKKRGRKVAPFVVPVVGGIAMEKEGYRAERVTAPFIAPKMTITAADLEKKAFGESPESGRTPEDRQKEVRAEHLDDLRNMVFRRIEQMAGEVISTGKLDMKHYASADDAANDRNPVTMQLRFYDATKGFENKYAFSKKFSEMTAQEKIAGLYDMASELRSRGVAATDLVLTADVTKMLLTDPDFLDYYDKLHVSIGEIKPETLPAGVVCNGGLNLNGVVFTIFTYDEKFEDLDGTVDSIFPAGTIAMLTPGMGTTVYSQVTFVKGGQFYSYAEPVVPREVADENNNMIEEQVFSRPIPYPLDYEGWLVADAYETPSVNP